MSKPRDPCYSIAKKLLQLFPDGLEEETVQSVISNAAISQALKATAMEPNGAERLRFINMLYFDKSHTFNGAADALFVHRSTAKRWNGQFVYLVAYKAGYLSKDKYMEMYKLIEEE